MRSGYLLLLFFLISAAAFAQQPEHCGTDPWLQTILQKDASSALKLQHNREMIRQYMQHPVISRGSADTIITIPVVVHVIHNGQPLDSGPNISYLQIKSQIDVLNECFNDRKQNADTFLVHAAFRSRIANAGIKFCLAAFDMNGDSTTGITRDSFPPLSQPQFDNVVKPFTQWDPTKYYNLWVANIIGGGGDVLGYSTMPNIGPSSEDGVVIDYIYFGRGPYLKANSHNGRDTMGKTAVHETGHWLGLYHTFYGGCAGMTPESCDTAGDYICDTPPEIEATYGFSNDLNQNTCHETPVDEKDMWENYMDYVDDNELLMFTTDQAVEMRAVLNTFRQSIQFSNATNCATADSVPVGIRELPAGVEASIYPNPSNGKVELRYSLTEGADIEIYNAVGERVAVTTVAAGLNAATTLDVSALPNGVYFMFLSAIHSQKTLKLSILR